MGLFLFVPLGDRLERKRLVVALLLAVCLGLGLMSVAQTLTQLMVLGFCVGISTVVPQVIVPIAADLAPEGRRGQVVGTVMSGVFLGVLMSRVVGGVVGQWLGWRAVLLGAALAGEIGNAPFGVVWLHGGLFENHA